MKAKRTKKTGTRRPASGKRSIILPSAPKEIARVEAFLLSANRSMHLDDGTLYRLLVAVTEAVNNAILHGNESNPSKSVRLQLQYSTKWVTIRVEDEGPGFDATTLPDPLDQRNLLKEHGRGVFLIRSLVDTVEFVTTKGGSAIIMKVNLELLRSGAKSSS